MSYAAVRWKPHNNFSETQPCERLLWKAQLKKEKEKKKKKTDYVES